jgi:hypothetical protein
MSASKDIGSKKSVKYPKPKIPAATLDSLFASYSVESNSKADPAQIEMWEAVAELKGWMMKKNDAEGFRRAAWGRVSEILSEAVDAKDPEKISRFCKMWEKVNINPKVNIKPNAKQKSEISIWARNENRSKSFSLSKSELELLDALIVESPSNKPNSPAKIGMIKAITELQRNHGRAPTQLEIGEKLDISTSKVSEWVGEMGISDLLSRSRATK